MNSSDPENVNGTPQPTADGQNIPLYSQDHADPNSQNSPEIDQIQPNSPQNQYKESSKVPVPGLLIFAWSVWLLGSWVVTLTLDPSIRAVRWMVFSGLFGLMILWPAVRLSQGWIARPPAAAGKPRPELKIYADSRWRTLVEWFALYMVFQAVIWPLRVSTDWSMNQTWWLDMAIGVWSLLAGAIVAWGCGGVLAVRRVTAMVLCVSLIVAEPVVMALVNRGAPEGQGIWWTMWVSPLEMVWEMTDSGYKWSDTGAELWATRVYVTVGVAVIAWLACGIGGMLSRGVEK